jgi:hypothetical protein
MAKWTIPPTLSREEVADSLWEEFKHWDGEKKFALREVVKYLREKDDVGTVVDTDVSGGS